ncbi:CaiB/BaiF CoA transferase family protein [Chloroflexota bacterium]
MSHKSVLEGIRVLDFSWVLAGPYATRLLADFGVEVIKVQPLLPAESQDRFARSYDNTWNRNKWGITLNLSIPEGVSLARKLVGICDVVVENFTPRVMANWGLGYDSLRQIKPDIIMLSMSTMGQTGPWRNYTGFGLTVQAFSGITQLTSFPGKPPAGLGFAYADHVAGLFASLALLGALEYRRKTGKGQYLDLSELEAMTALLGGTIVDYTRDGNEPLPQGNGSGQAAPHNVYRCRGGDRWCALAVFNDEEWQRCKHALGNPSWAEAERFATAGARWQHRAELDRLVAQWTEKLDAEEVMKLMQQHGIAAGVMQNAADIVIDPQLNSRNFFVELDHPELGKTVSDAAPIKMSRSPADYWRAAPTSGQDNNYVYRELLGLSEPDMVRLREDGII